MKHNAPGLNTFIAMAVIGLCLVMIVNPGRAQQDSRNLAIPTGVARSCMQSTYAEVYALAYPDGGLTRPDGVVPEGARVNLMGVAREVAVDSDCTSHFR